MALVEGILLERFPPGEALLKTVPVADFRLAKVPAEIHLLPSPTSEEVYQAAL